MYSDNPFVSKDLRVDLSNPTEAFFQRMISEVEEYAILFIDKEGKILTWNRGAEKIEGYSASEIIGKNYRLFYLPEDRERGVPERVLNEATTMGRATHEGWKVRKDGAKFWSNITITAIHDDQKAITGFLKVTRDLTQQKLAEEEHQGIIDDLRRKNEQLQKSEERYHNMVAEVQDYAIILLDEHGTILDWNLGAEKLKGYTPAEIIGKSFHKFYGEDDLVAKLPEQLLNLARINGRVNHEGWRIRKDGTRFWGNVTISALHDSKGNVIGFTKVTRDLTERKLAEESLEAKANELMSKNKAVERLNEELTSFTYVASHDLKEPLRKISTYASRMENEGLSEKGRSYLEKVKTSALRMQNLIEDLLSYSKVSNESKGFELIDLNEVVQSVRNDLEIVIAEKEGEIRSDNLPTIHGIRYQLHQLFSNLFVNSMKFAKPGVAPVIVMEYDLSSAEDVKAINIATDSEIMHHISLRDNGVGFPPELTDKIFVPFQRLHPAGTFSGTGIGLAIVKRVMENHKGVIEAHGVPDEGAVFDLYFPVKIAN